MLRILSVLCLVVMTTSAVRMSAQVYPYRDGTPDVTGYRSEVMAEVMIQESEFVRLADAIPADKYTWRGRWTGDARWSYSKRSGGNMRMERGRFARSRRNWACIDQVTKQDPCHCHSAV